mgnify:CR=1|jgi:hypothetical protein
MEIQSLSFCNVIVRYQLIFYRKLADILLLFVAGIKKVLVDEQRL